MGLGIIVCGIGGRMGGAVVRAIQQAPDLELVAAVDKPGSARIGKDAGAVAGAGELGIPITSNLPAALKRNSVIIDFTLPEASLGFLKYAAESRTPIVIATTGFNVNQQAEIKRRARRTPTVLSANTSLGVNVLMALVADAAKRLGNDYDIEIIEAHHRFKKDAPSGTALALGQSAANALGRDLDKVMISGRKGIIGERGKKEIALLSIRAGDIVGEHSVIFGGIGERIELIHRAHSRDSFAKGALRAAKWLAKKKPGLYNMRDVLGL
ncbi:MAG TPA: 4-hydroxy-tetrahydrodipicolinate reductase [Candidatus Binatia bacterium]|nr:4-hydroxy-tetrahydrodipicolinate reductase [Candidatus Binatia bacterium]